LSHDPKRAAYYLTGQMSRRRRRTFEEHMLSCEECWREVEAARRGRALAESGKEVAPQFLRERVRASMEASEPAPGYSRRRVAVAGSVAMLLIAAAAVPLLVRGEEQPREIEAILADFHNDAMSGDPVAPELPAKVGDLVLIGARSKWMDGMEVKAHVYRDQAGHEVSVYLGDDIFPEAEGAERERYVDGWTAELDGAVIYCTDWPEPLMVVGDNEKEVAMLVRGLEEDR
jgi:hypothetical protein